MVRTGDYTARLLDAAKSVKVMSAGNGRFRCKGFTAFVIDGYPARGECEGFKADGECIHLDAIWYVLDYGEMQA